MRNNTVVTLTLFLALTVNIVVAQETRLHDLLPDPSELKGWHFSREAECYEGDKLFDLINGGADLFYEYAFVNVINAQYRKDNGSKIQLEIYEMDSDSSAYGIFSSIYYSSEVVTDIGLYSVINEQYISFVKGRYYVNIAWILRKDANLESLELFARNVERNIQQPGKLPSLLNAAKHVNRSGIPVYFRGNIALSNVYYFDYRDWFQIEQGVAFKDQRWLKLLFVYNDLDVAQDVFSGIKDFLENSRRFVDPGMIYQGYTCSDNKGNKLVFRLGEGFIIVVIALDPDVQLMPEQEEFYHQVESALTQN
jgi:hypothetical protein